MSQANIRVVRAGLDAFNARDGEAFAALATEDFVWLPALPGAVEQGSYVGRQGIARYFRETGDTWAQLAVVADALRDLDGRVLVLGRAVGRGRGSGAAAEMPLAFVVEFRGERMARVLAFRSHGQALRAARLED